MNNDINYEHIGPSPEQAIARRISDLAQADNTSDADDIEVIDLDDPRGQIKPTTWHRLFLDCFRAVPMLPGNMFMIFCGL